MRRAGGFWQAVVQAQARHERASIQPGRLPAPIEDTRRMRRISERMPPQEIDKR
jgi:hypothetical protein